MSPNDGSSVGRGAVARDPGLGSNVLPDDPTEPVVVMTVTIVELSEGSGSPPHTPPAQSLGSPLSSTLWDNPTGQIIIKIVNMDITIIFFTVAHTKKSLGLMITQEYLKLANQSKYLMR